MANTTRKKSKVSKQGDTSHAGSENSQVDLLPGNSYIPSVGVHTTLLVFNAFFLPRTTLLQDITRIEIDPAQLSSLDHPQHPFLDPLTKSPLSTLVYICFGTAVLQSWWAGFVHNWRASTVVYGSDNQKRIERAMIDRQKAKAFGKAWLTTLAASFVFHLSLVLFGAPFSWHASRTYTLAFLLATLTVYTPAFVFGPPAFGSSSESLIKRLEWIRLFAEFKIRSPVERAVVYPAIGALTGAWLGAIPIALDWDRPWQAQAWPLTPTYGAIIGYIFASIISLTFNTVRPFILD
ncbi:hypothetical protein AGABI2DRAFT_180310 [Agaricus bisporus var. bisporus H97]|uniref:hypothetical protein n=1 Tax=Agaricus bisporus var. bisporus (strain H97 / ATCC MYA-4626 / FGSC 10389) TaxID=936046 RepID=UPI00029F71F8|nr:hypothetical protein AGABI2DRAFT_180310 [Agaricus bisporus var. bisporus H97]EKV43854.1 hypothetical protein AGABI2DRAFT_180310 [Agaricus bisporus var. bisporus H97]